MIVSRGAEDGTMKPEALSEEGGLLLALLLAKSIATAALDPHDPVKRAPLQCSAVREIRAVGRG